MARSLRLPVGCRRRRVFAAPFLLLVAKPGPLALQFCAASGRALGTCNSRLHAACRQLDPPGRRGKPRGAAAALRRSRRRRLRLLSSWLRPAMRFGGARRPAGLPAKGRGCACSLAELADGYGRATAPGERAGCASAACPCTGGSTEQGREPPASQIRADLLASGAGFPHESLKPSRLGQQRFLMARLSLVMAFVEGGHTARGHTRGCFPTEESRLVGRATFDDLAQRLGLLRAASPSRAQVRARPEVPQRR